MSATIHELGGLAPQAQAAPGSDVSVGVFSGAEPASPRTRAAPPASSSRDASRTTLDDTSRLTLLQVAANCVDLARLADSGEFVEDVAVLRAKCSEDLLIALAAGIDARDEPMRDALTFLLGAIKHYCEADSLRRPVWARAIAPNLTTVRDLYHLAGRS